MGVEFRFLNSFKKLRNYILHDAFMCRSIPMKVGRSWRGTETRIGKWMDRHVDEVEQEKERFVVKGIGILETSSI